MFRIIFGLALSVNLACAASPIAPPTVTIVEPQTGQLVKGTITLKIDMVNKDRHLSKFELWMDGKQAGIPDPGKMGKEHSFELALDTTLLAEGKHILTARACALGDDAPWGESSVEFTVDNQPLDLHFLLDPPEPRQGQVFYIKVFTNKPIDSLSINLMEQEPQFFPTQDGSYIAALGARPSFASGDYPFTIKTVINGKSIELSGNLQLLSGKFLSERIDMPVETSAKVLGRTEEQKATEQQEIVDTVTKVDPDLYEKETVIKPVEGKLTSPFYITRTFSDGNSESHTGVDYAAAEGTPIMADGAGIVRLATEHIARGKFVCIDHGRGWFSLMYHMSEIDVEAGQHVEKGQVIGKVGMTGYANGYHVHWEMRLNRWAVDPRQFLTRGFEY